MDYSRGLTPHYTASTKLGVPFTGFMATARPPPLGRVLRAKRLTAERAAERLLIKRRNVTLIMVFGSISDGSVTGWSSDIDLLAIVQGKGTEFSQQIIVDRQPVFVDYFSPDRLRRYVGSITEREDLPLPLKMANLRRFVSASVVYQRSGALMRYKKSVAHGIRRFWTKARKGKAELLDDFGWYYVGALEALKYGMKGIAAWKLQQALQALVLWRLIDRKIFIRKFFPDDRVLRQLLGLGFSRQFSRLMFEAYGGSSEKVLATRIEEARRHYLRVVGQRKWLGTMSL